MNPLLPLSAVLVVLGAFFLAVGAVGLVRFPDVLSRLQGVLKAASLGTGCLMAGLLLRAHSVFTLLKLLFVWGLFLVCLGYLGQLVGRSALLAARRR
ncbi:cation:proton antiporter [Melittangium boletus]|uniref:Cation:proton antiporter n=1 Tax=Melittangium boletus DSM 14713 TaxID=1294270 RepID=A0A250IA78_9BACT|nr:monovalent cation/H(+) antiporter subunit G [Melittangium boletus]ATB28769.1 cation:proton antiporter [Melittangium boletus DSM 14713]